MKQMAILLAIIIFIFLYFVVGAEDFSTKLENYTTTKLSGMDSEKWTVLNIRYCYYTGKYQRALDLTNKFLEQYDKYDVYEKNDQTDLIDDMNYLKALTVDRMMETPMAKSLYYKYLEKFPQGKNIDKANERLKDLGGSF
jgi:hypothetical protein